MSDVNIFDVTKETPQGTWASFEKVGDSVQGTYVGFRNGVDGYGNEQTIYHLWNRASNTLYFVGVRNTKKPVLDRMAKVAFGQIVGFIYSGDKQTKDKKGTFKNIDVREDPKFIDKEWMEDQKARALISGGQPTPMVISDDESDIDRKFDEMTSDDSEEEEDVPFHSEEELLKKIADLAKTKLGATPADVKEKVMEATNLPFLKANYEEIVERLKLV